MNDAKTFEQIPGLRVDQTIDHTRGRLPAIDVLRGVSILALILLHTNLRIRFADTALGQHVPRRVAEILFHNGRYGVIIFFVISGFLITSTCLRRWGSLDRISLGGFYRMRFARIAPLLFALLAILSFLHLAHLEDFTIDPDRASLSQALLSALTFHLNWLEARHGYLPGAWDILWSLSVEEMFYLLFPLACLLLRRTVTIVGVLCVFIALGPLARTVFTHNAVWAHHSYLSCMDAISMGCLAAIAIHRRTISERSKVVLRISGLALVALILARLLSAIRQLEQSGLDVTALALGVSTMLVTFSANDQRSRFFGRTFRWLGTNSYEVYLTHMFVVCLFATLVAHLRQPTTMLLFSSYVAIVTISGFVGGTVERYYSGPANRLLRHWPVFGPATQERFGQSTKNDGFNAVAQLGTGEHRRVRRCSSD